MTIEEQLKAAASVRLERKIDVVDAVMAEVSKKPYMQRKHITAQRWRIGAGAVAAVAALVLVVNIFATNSKSYDTEGMGDMLVQVNDYGSWNHIEEMAENPMEYLYDEDYQNIFER